MIQPLIVDRLFYFRIRKRNSKWTPFVITVCALVFVRDCDGFDDLLSSAQLLCSASDGTHKKSSGAGRGIEWRVMMPDFKCDNETRFDKYYI